MYGVQSNLDFAKFNFLGWHKSQKTPCVWNQNDLTSGDDEGDLAFIAFLMSF